MFAIMTQSGAYGRKEYICDTDADIANLPKDDNPGSAALIAANGNLYILNCQKEWIKQGGSSEVESGSSEEIIKLQNQISELTAANQKLTQDLENLQKELGVI